MLENVSTRQLQRSLGCRCVMCAGIVRSALGERLVEICEPIGVVIQVPIALGRIAIALWRATCENANHPCEASEEGDRENDREYSMPVRRYLHAVPDLVEWLAA